MGGLEEIIKQINADAEAEKSEIIANAQKECDEIKAKSDADIAEIVETKTQKSEQSAALALEKIKSSANMKQKQEYLAFKQELILDIFKKALNRIETLSDNEYFDMLVLVAEKNAHQEEEGVICLSKKDLGRLPEDFEKKLADKGVKLKVSKEPVDIESGMILDYGDIEENCTFSALIREGKEVLTDKLNKYIFG
ncbi:MAG: hypothetical protein E7290_14405 [Lachnospiraceae bacterium]|nr:hypothetical protein [Lachnospiraceae bacterium]